ncbi:hypothetical protein HGP28_10460 [Vibrio sp. SM6]|uniref:Uncharacterized protein n=1 Tax=Vibrio agarilyticus TaxID=2726741 RepID=A0A7X8YGR9_9VIBR|nr:hypothetical protein [Vibrio agarilyticus]NLS13313.1 hypothetical protein [Vibrio agarilyticus]
MAQTMHLDSLAMTSQEPKKSYAVNIKGLVVHILDILFTEAPSVPRHYSDNLSSHMQRDIGLMR